MSDRDRARVVAWDRELTAVHERLREALRMVRESLDPITDAMNAAPDSTSARANDASAAEAARSDLRLYCHGFCAALRRHHAGEDVELFPALVAQNPELRPTIDKLTDDHHAIASLLNDLDRALDSADQPADVARRIDGVAAIMESHFRFEERALLEPLATLDIGARREDVYGPI